MIKNSSFRLACALLGLVIIILPWLGLPDKFKTILFALLGLLIILFSLAEISNREIDRPATAGKNIHEGGKSDDRAV